MVKLAKTPNAPTYFQKGLFVSVLNAPTGFFLVVLPNSISMLRIGKPIKTIQIK